MWQERRRYHVAAIAKPDHKLAILDLHVLRWAATGRQRGEYSHPTTDGSNRAPRRIGISGYEETMQPLDVAKR